MGLKIAGPFLGGIQKRLIIVSLRMSNRIFERSVFAEPQDVDIHRSAVEPFAQTMNERLVISLTEFSDNLGKATGSEVAGQAGDNSLLDIFAGGPPSRKRRVASGEGTNGGLAVIRSKRLPRTASKRSPTITSRFGMAET